MPGQPVVLDELGGLVATARPEDLPEGASPRCWDVDFIVGRFTQRPGEESVYTVVLNNFGPEPGGAAADIDTESLPWTNPGNILLSGSSYATVTLAGEVGVSSVLMIQGGYYALSETPAVAFSGAGSGASGTPIVVNHGTYKTVSGVTVTAPGSYTGAITVTFTGAASTSNNATGTVVTLPVGQTSDSLHVTQFPFALPSTYLVKGIEVQLTGLALNHSTDVYVQLIKGGSVVGNIENALLQYDLAGTVTLGGETDLFGETWLYSDINASNFGVAIWVNSTASGEASLNNASITIYGTPTPGNFTGVVSANLNNTDLTNIILDSNGLSRKEDVTNLPNELQLVSGIPAVASGLYLKGLDAGNGAAYLAYSDLTQGRSQPMQYNGQWCDRITQVGPGQAPVFTPQQSTSDTFDIVQITQPPQMSDPGDPGHFQALLWSNGAGSTAPGNVITIYYKILTASGPNVPDLDLVNAFNSGQPVYVYMSDLPTPFANGTYQVTSVGQGNVAGSGAEYERYYFTYNVVSSAYIHIGGPDTGTGYYQHTLATMQTQTPVPGLAVGNQITISGNSASGYNAEWTITQALNSGEMAITETSVTNGVATYNYALQTGEPPVTGELITITGTTNANGALNLTNATIASSTAYGGTVDTLGTAVTWVSGDQFGSLSGGGSITISGTGYTILTVNSPTSITLTATAGSQTGAVYLAGTGNTGSFTIAVPTVNNYPTVPEAGQATTAGTLFTFDPGFAVLGTSTDPIYNTGTGGSFVFASATSQLITPGVKQGSVFFITRNGAVTRPAPPVQFTIPENTGAILASQIPIGPPNVVARGITFTESGQNGVKGGSFYTYDQPVTYVVNGTTYVADALIINDNTTTSASFTFTDQVLLASEEIDIQGNNYFNLIELGNPAWMFQYAGRMLYGLCQTKIQNFLNMSFDGGYLPTGSSLLPLPAGWTVPSLAPAQYTATAFAIAFNIVTITSANMLIPGALVFISGFSVGTYLNNVPLTVIQNIGNTSFTAAFAHADVSTTSDSGTIAVASSTVGLVPSLDFGNAFRIFNWSETSLSDQVVLFQGAYQDSNNVNIIQPDTPYSIRVKARSVDISGQGITIAFEPYSNGNFGASLGSASFVFNMGEYAIQTAPIITGNGLISVPSSLVIAVITNGIEAGSGVEIDRIEIFPTNNPVDATTIWTSYAAVGTPNYEAVDGVTGSLGVGTENPQPAQGAFELLEQLYIEKTKSLQVTQDSPNYEPNQWQVRQASDKAGAVGPNAFDEGEEFTVSASRNGVYFFDGGKPMPIIRELQSTAKGANLWETINWDAGSTTWIRNDLQNRRLLIGVPMITPNPWLPTAPTLTPTSPNVILMCNYTGCPTGEELAMSSEVHITMFGDLKALDMRRKWSLWQILCPIAEFVVRPDTFTDQLFLCNGNQSGKMYQLVNGGANGGQNTDDGAAINWLYTTYGFTKAKQGQQMPGLGALRKVWYYLAATMEGVGQVAGKLFSNSLGALPQNTFTIPLPFTLSYPQQNDQERVIEIGGQRLFIQFSSVGTGGYAEIGPVIVDGEVDRNAPHRGVAQ